jgi:anaerobic selenocysteine-containing dehydrogenase
VGTHNVNTNSRLCMSSAVAGYRLTLCADAPPCSYEDLDHAQTAFIAGSNMAWAHPVLFRRLEDARRRNPMKIIVAEPHRTAPKRPSSPTCNCRCCRAERPSRRRADSLTGQPNAMGGREVGGLSNLLSGHRDLANPEHRAKVARPWGGTGSCPARRDRGRDIPGGGRRADQVALDCLHQPGPVDARPGDQATVRRALERAEFVVVQEAFAGSATARHAHLLLPASNWGEKDGALRRHWQSSVPVQRRLLPHTKGPCDVLRRRLHAPVRAA